MFASRKAGLSCMTTMFILIIVCSGFVLGPLQASADEGERTMKVVRIYTGPDNKSHFEDLQIPLKDSGKVGLVSELMKATGVVFRDTAGDYNYDFHTAPRRQFVVNRKGRSKSKWETGPGAFCAAGTFYLPRTRPAKGTSAAQLAASPANRCSLRWTETSDSLSRST